jgi:hypothetical protein
VPKLSDLGFSTGMICETIVSTYNPDGTPNAAPMGAIMQDDEQQLIINIFNNSNTHQNLQATKCAVINLTNNIEVFYKTAFKEANSNGKLPVEWFEKAKVVWAPKLRLADGSIEVKVDSLVPLGSDKTKASLTVQSVEAAQIYPQAPCRAISLTLEAIIHATRVKAYINEPTKQAQVNKLLETISSYHEVVNRVAPNSSYQLVMADLQKRIDSWRKQP